VRTEHNIHTFIISLPKDKDRRDYLGKQLAELNVPFSILDAVHGKSLSQVEMDAYYDRDRALRLFNRELSAGEIGCALSHVAIYRKMVEENIPHALVLEDDASVLDQDLAATLSKLAALYPERKRVAVMLNHVKRYDANKKTPLDEGRCVYDAYRGVCTHGYFITRAAAEVLVKNLYPVYVVADKWEYFQDKYIDVKALVPYPIGLSAGSLSSSIEAMGIREKKVMSSASLLYYMRRWLWQLKIAVTSRPFVRIERQEKSALDLQ
jgi:glycosyl transferase family 25